MKYRLVIDHSALTITPWYRIERQEEDGTWRLLTSGFATKTVELFNKLKAGEDFLEVVEEFDTEADKEEFPMKMPESITAPVDPLIDDDIPF